jgi:hypothetical protein
MGAISPGGEGEGAVANALEALRAEVAGLRCEIEMLLRGGTADYAPTLSAMAASLAAIEHHPALQLTPQAFSAQLGQAAEAVRAQERRQLSDAVQRFDGAAALLGGLVEQRRPTAVQDRWLTIAWIVGGVLSVALWISLSGPIARALPRRWHLAESMAAASLHDDRWDAGQQLMAGADPMAWAVIEDDRALVARNRLALAACRTQASRTGRAVSCPIKLDKSD